MDIKGVQITPEPIIRKTGPGIERPGRAKTTVDFQDVLFRELAGNQEIKISAHAQKRMQERNINLDDKDMANITRAVRQAGVKGVKESLLLYGELAMVASVANKTIVTAMHRDDATDKIFTNIDGAIIINK